ncbi:MAG TPA: hypothetical protein VMW49_01345, partial [Candidatus Dormibacteraeota bacterium]|nr:hypothetical protein [Candidatus Dormibacteraeota bacterium]
LQRLIGPLPAALTATVVAALAAGCGSGSPAPVGSTAGGSSPPTTAGATNSGRCPSAVATGSGGAESAPPGDIPDNQAYVPFSPASGGYRITVPEGWARSESGSTVAFTDKLNTIKVELTSVSSAPTAASARADQVPRLESKGVCGTVAVSTVARPAGPAVLLSYQAPSSPDPVTGRVYRDDVERSEFWKAGTEAVITLSSPAGSDNVDPWRTVTSSFAWTR